MRLTAEQFQNAVRAGCQAAIATTKRHSVQKTLQLRSTVTKAAGDRVFTFTISSASVDRDRDTIDPRQIDLESFQSNPVVLWAHNNSLPPIARASNLRVVGDKLVADVTFPEPGISALADEVCGLVEAGFVNAASIGFAPTEPPTFNDQRGGFDFGKVELHEFSLVPVPANPDALVQRTFTGGEVDRAIVRQLVHEEIRHAQR